MTSATITGLLQDTTYRVQVRAENALCEGSWSASGSGSFSPRPEPEPVPASVQSAYVDGRTLTVTFDKALRESSVPAPSAFDVRADGERRDVHTVGVDAAVLTLTLVQPVDLARGVTLTYRQPGSRLLTDVNGFRIRSFSNQAVQPTTPTPAMPFAALVVLAVLLARRGWRQSERRSADPGR